VYSWRSNGNAIEQDIEGKRDEVSLVGEERRRFCSDSIGERRRFVNSTWNTATLEHKRNDHSVIIFKFYNNRTAPSHAMDSSCHC
jgi:hypothetical protein